MDSLARQYYYRAPPPRFQRRRWDYYFNDASLFFLLGEAQWPPTLGFLCSVLASWEARLVIPAASSAAAVENLLRLLTRPGSGLLDFHVRLLCSAHEQPVALLIQCHHEKRLGAQESLLHGCWSTCGKAGPSAEQRWRPTMRIVRRFGLVQTLASTLRSESGKGACH
jgi:hypothetical protein